MLMTKIIGLTGGIASGKSTVTKIIRESGFKVIDADQVVHKLQAKGGKLYQALLEWLGPEILDADGELDRPKLSQMIFANPDNMKISARLQNSIIRQELACQRDQLKQTEEIFFMDIPLLIEEKYIKWFDEIWLVFVDKEKQLQRLMARNNYSREEAELRLSHQMPLTDKKSFASLIIDNNGDLITLKEQILDALQRL
ncbi:TPA: dephospho-CoA kinase [Streptococcus agalactiae]|uniref:dephospho-CoA kinase n=1 Tax=Streptococcus agalactiae TaxID=1311 RepID=UPI00178C2F51|nr:dephospho-CoA kinase [Streptococcus agalactiae]HEN8991131.1 dephospho-CoA kinase [Streptococcus agalactiae]HEO0070747.1 dephospho-CoA kinase [Streptococcus agalactiae]HEO0931775.1 dephospho-CoA kinase [Streptococcus agalactiae]HEO3361972.1 dephospho-CoA kinase [Streptococcus agalactiae]HEO4645661.1 dephospho-CoA kinase [Streptococcus agalactiae]